MPHTNTKLDSGTRQPPLVAAGTVLVVVMILASFPGVAAAAVTESAFLTEMALTDGLKRDPAPNREMRSRREASVTASKSRPHGWSKPTFAQIGLTHWGPDRMQAVVAPQIEATRAEPGENRVTVLHLDLPPPPLPAR